MDPAAVEYKGAPVSPFIAAPGQTSGNATVWEHASGRRAAVYTSHHHYLVGSTPSWRRLYRVRWRLK
jgi:hypothetical protein